MPLVVEIKENEKLIINGALIKFDSTVKVHFLNRVALLHERQILRPEEANTPAKRLYFALQSLYVCSPEEWDRFYGIYEQRLNELCRGTTFAPLIELNDKVTSAVRRNDLYNALKAVREFFKTEERLLNVGNG